MQPVFAPKLRPGDTVRVVAPARSMMLPWITEDILELSKRRFEQLGLRVTFGKNVRELDEFNSSAISSRVEDLHDAFADPSVKLISTIMGGFNSNELLPHLDYDLIRRNPKLLCGYSDITALENGIFAKTGLVTYSGPHYFDFGEQQGFEYTLEHFRKCLFSQDPYSIATSAQWSNDRWGRDQANRSFHRNPGLVSIVPGEATGRSLISNLVTFLSLSGSEFCPSLRGAILFIEEDYEQSLVHFNRNMVALTLRPDFEDVRGIVFGRFQPESKIGEAEIRLVIRNNERLQRIPIIAGADFGHTTPRFTFPIGGTVRMSSGAESRIEVLEH